MHCLLRSYCMGKLAATSCQKTYLQFFSVLIYGDMWSTWENSVFYITASNIPYKKILKKNPYQLVVDSVTDYNVPILKNSIFHYKVLHTVKWRAWKSYIDWVVLDLRSIEKLPNGKILEILFWNIYQLNTKTLKYCYWLTFSQQLFLLYFCKSSQEFKGKKEKKEKEKKKLIFSLATTPDLCNNIIMEE